MAVEPTLQWVAQELAAKANPQATNRAWALLWGRTVQAVAHRVTVRPVDQTAVEANLAVALRWVQMVRD